MINPCKHGWCENCRQLSCWWKRLRGWLSLFSVLVLFSGCGMLPLAPGFSTFQSASASGVLRQSQNPKQESKQVYKRTDGAVTESVETTIGAAQKDVAREMAAKLGSLKGLVYLGALVFLFGVASAFWLPLKAIVGSITTSAVIAAAGLALIVLPSLVVGNEILILCGALGAAGLYWFSNRHGKLRGELNTILKS